MNKERKTVRRSQKGIALLIAIFVLLLISVVAIALLVSSGTETALGANYRASSTVYYAALAGLEEARGRLFPKNPNYFTPAVVPTPFPLGQAVYMMNRLSGENIVPWDSSNQYYDKEYGAEFFPLSASSAGVYPAYSVWDYTGSLSIPGPVYKWVRITAATEQSLYLDVNSDGVYDPSTPIYYDPAAVDSSGNPAPSLIVTLTPPATAEQVLQITALAYLPNGSQKLLQYVVAPVALNLGFPAALTLDGPNVSNTGTYPFALPWGANFFVDGTDQYFYASAGSCVAGSSPSPSPVRGIGYSNSGSGDMSGAIIASAAGGANHGDYKGLGPASPNVYNVGNSPPPSPPPPPTLTSNLQTLSGINSVVTTLSQSADLTIAGPVTQSDSNNLMPAGMSATNPMTVVVNGDFTENGWTGTGYGTLVVTGIFTYDPNSSWDGVVLVIGKGVFTVAGTSFAQGMGRINGAVLIATTEDLSGNPLSSLGSPTYSYSYQGSQGIYYSSCWVQYVQSATKYQVLSFHEIPQS
jgi:hypothetical protein